MIRSVEVETNNEEPPNVGSTSHRASVAANLAGAITYVYHLQARYLFTRTGHKMKKIKLGIKLN